MLTENRKYHFVGELILKRSHVLSEQSQPKDDKINWLFLKAEGQQFSFVYRLIDSLAAKYEKPFKVDLSFTMFEAVIKTIKLHHTYEVLRGEEIIGTVRLINLID